MTSNPTKWPAWWENPIEREPCGRLTKAGTPCRLGRGSAAVYAGFRMVWESPACMTHLTPEEREAREAVEARVRAAEAKLEPACWSWPLPPTSEDDLVELFSDGDIGPDIVRQLRLDPDFMAFGVFHNGRCAICGCTDRLVQDHDYLTGLIRGKLCRGCNTSEGVSKHPLFVKYRARNPASILGVQLPYTGFDWEDGVPIGGWATQAHRRRDHDLWTDNPSARLGL